MDKQELIKKIKALADGGVGGEKENAQKLLAELMLKYDIKEEEIAEETVKDFDFTKPNFFMAGELMTQVLYSIIGKELGEDKGIYHWKGSKKLFIRCTTAEFLEFEAKFNFYMFHFKKEAKRYYSAFVQANKIFPPVEKTKERDEDYKLSNEDVAMLMLAENLERHDYRLQIEGGKNCVRK